MAAPDVTVTFDIPVRGEDFDTFSPKVPTFITDLGDLQVELNSFTDYFESFQTTMEGHGDAATLASSNAEQSATDAANSKTEVDNQLTRATGLAESVEGFRDDALASSLLAVSNAGLPSLTGNSKLTAVVNGSETDVEYDALGYAVGDAIRSIVGTVSSPEWLELNGSSYDDTIYPELYAVLGSTVLPNISRIDGGNAEIAFYIRTGA